MRTAISIIVAAVCLQAASANATVYLVDPRQSYVSIDVPTWERGEPWWYIGADGSEVLSGYSWRGTTRNQRFAISGSIDVMILGPTVDGLTGVQLDSTRLVSTAPPELGFQMLGFVSFDPATGAFKGDNSCHSSSEFPVWCWVPWPFEGTTGALTSELLTVDGTSYGFAFSGVDLLDGGLEPPPDPVISLNNLGYTYHVYAAVPEPSSALLTVGGFAGLLLSRRLSLRRLGCKAQGVSPA